MRARPLWAFYAHKLLRDSFRLKMGHSRITAVLVETSQKSKQLSVFIVEVTIKNLDLDQKSPYKSSQVMGGEEVISGDWKIQKTAGQDRYKGEGGRGWLVDPLNSLIFKLVRRLNRHGWN